MASYAEWTRFEASQGRRRRAWLNWANWANWANWRSECAK